MIVACPSCRARFKIDETKIKPPGVRLRCAKCQNLFAVRKRLVQSPAPSAPAAEAGAPPAPSEGGPRGFRVVVAHAEPSVCAVVADLLMKEKFEVVTSNDGVDALMKIQCEHPVAAVIDAALPKMYGFELCEFMKRNESLRDVKVLLIAAVHNQDRYRRTAANLYGADDVLEEREIPSSLPARLRALLPDSPDRAVQEEREPEAGGAADAPAEEDEHSEERERAWRLARIIVSDIALYNPETFEEGIRSGELVNLVRDELEEGYTLFRSRIKAPVIDERDFIREALDACVQKKRRELGLPDPGSEETPSTGDESAQPGADRPDETGIGDDDL